MGTLNNPNNKLTCPDPGNVKSLIFEYSKMDIVQGSQTLLGIDLSKFFIPLDKYHYEDITIAAGETINVDSCNAGNSGEVAFIAIIVEYPRFDTGNVEIPAGDKYIQFVYPDGGNTYNIGKIMILSGSNAAGFGWLLDSSPGGLTLTNPHTNFSVGVKILLFT